MRASAGDTPSSRGGNGEEHHGGLPDDAPTTTGSVTRIRAVSSRFGPDPAKPAGNVRVPIPETAVVVDVSKADGWYPEPDRPQFNGYLVDLRLMEG